MKLKLNFLLALCAVFFLTYQNCGQPQWQVTPIEESEKLASAAVNGGKGLVCGLLVQDSQGGMRTSFAATEIASIEVSTLPPGSKVHVTAVDLDTNALLEDFGTITTPQRLQFSFSQFQVDAGRSVLVQGTISQSAEVTTSCSQILKAFSPSNPDTGGNRGTPTTTTLPYFPVTTTTTMPSAQVPTSIELEPGHHLYTDQVIQLQKARMLLQKDGNLVIYDSAGAPIWHSLTAGTADYCTPNCFAVFQTDGNFVTYKEAANGEVTFYWTTQTGSNIPSIMIFQQNEPYLKIVNKNTGEIIWSSSQATTPPPDSPPPTTTTTTVPSNPAPQPVKHLVVCRRTTVVGSYSFLYRSQCEGAVDAVICREKSGYRRVAVPICIQPLRVGGDPGPPPPAKPQGLCAYEKSTCTTELECESGFTMEDRGTCQ